MIDPVMARLIEDVANLKTANEVNLSQIIARLQKLEEEAEQTRVDKEQAERRELARLREVEAKTKAG